MHIRSLGAMAMVPFSEGIASVMDKQDKFGESYSFMRHVPGQPYCYLPRNVKQVQGLHVLEDHRVTAPMYEPHAPLVPPQTDDQASVIEASAAYLGIGTDHIVEAPTGFGKTYVGCAVASLLKQRVLIIITKNDLIDGWKDTLIELFGISPTKIGHVQQKKCKYEGCDFVIAMVHSLVEREYPADFYNHFGLIIFDEVHRLGAEYFAKACEKFPAKHRLGLSATPDRKDGREALFQAHIGPVLVKGTWIPLKATILVKKTGYSLPKEHAWDEKAKCMVYGPMNVVPGQMANVNKAMAISQDRNQEIASFTKQAYDAGRTILLVSDLKEDHLHPMFHHLCAAGVPGEDIGYYYGGMSKADLKISKTKKRVVLATYLMVGEGTNAPHWDTLVPMTPRSDIRQVLGRITRFVEHKKTPTVLELVDNHAILKTFHFARLKQYYALGATIIEV